jgi:hypothetical protein
LAGVEPDGGLLGAGRDAGGGDDGRLGAGVEGRLVCEEGRVVVDASCTGGTGSS